MEKRTNNRKALFSVTDKKGIEKLAECFVRHRIEIISTGGTAEAIRKAGIAVTEVSEYTKFPELFDGRLKTIHPRIAGGVLYDRNNANHAHQAVENGIEPIDFVVVNLYDFSGTVSKSGVTLEQAIEKIDIGGPSWLRAAAKNYKSVTVIPKPCDYDTVIKEMDANDGNTTEKLRFNLAFTVFCITLDYEREIKDYLMKYFHAK